MRWRAADLQIVRSIRCVFARFSSQRRKRYIAFLFPFPLSKLNNIQKNVSLGKFTTFEVGGPARYFLCANEEEEVASGFEFALANDLPVFVLGGGSNILVSDHGFDGLVIRINLKGPKRGSRASSKGRVSDSGVITVGAGEDWDSFVADCVGRDLAGVECLSGIPGTIGGTPVQNVGAYGQEVSETITSVRCYDRTRHEVVELSNEQCRFSYRTSIFNSTRRDRYVVLSVTYALEKNGLPKIAYKDLIEYFRGRKPSLAETRTAVLSIRRAKSMVIDAADPNRRSAGSFFKNPIVSKEKFNAIALTSAGDVPHFPAGPLGVKIPAAWLIERAGFQKGYSMGNAGISTNHTLAIINRGGATASEIVALKSAIQKAVFDTFGIELVPEPIFVGDISAKI